MAIDVLLRITAGGRAWEDAAAAWRAQGADGVVAPVPAAAFSGDAVVVADGDAMPEPGALEQARAAISSPDRVAVFPRRAGAWRAVGALYGGVETADFAVSRLGVERAGGLFDPALTPREAAGDFGLRARKVGMTIGATSAGLVLPPPPSPRDAAAFAALRERWAEGFDPAWGHDMDGIAGDLALEALEVLDRESPPRDGPGRVKDWRIMAAISRAAFEQGHVPPESVFRAGLVYLRWISRLSARPVQARIAGGIWAMLARPSPDKAEPCASA
jgi:hypothetical protein